MNRESLVQAAIEARRNAHAPYSNFPVGVAVAAGHRNFRCAAIVAVTNVPISPCGSCRQILAEFHPSLPIISSTLDGRTEAFVLDQLLPRASTGILNRP